MSAKPHIVVCGGGAGGIELAIGLARNPRLAVTLVDREEAHMWKPLLHELASGSLDAASHEVSFLALARWHGFTFSHGPLEGLDRTSRTIVLGAVSDRNGRPLIPQRRISYDLIVLAIGGVTNDFGIAGVKQHALALDSARQAEEIHARVMHACMSANYAAESARPPHFPIAIVGGGATGVELAAELSATTKTLLSYGLDRLDSASFIAITLINADSRLLMQLPERLAEDVTVSLRDLGVSVLNGEAVVEVAADGISTRSGKWIASGLTVWAAGVRAPPFLGKLADLEINRLGQVVVKADLRSTRDDRIIALGDCAACPWHGRSGQVPARAQVSHQQARYLVAHISSLLAGKPVPPFRYRDLVPGIISR